MDENDLKEEELLKEINDDIARQVVEEIEGEQEDINPEGGEGPEEPKKKWFKKRYIAFGAAGLLLILIVTGVVVANSLLNRVKQEKESDINFADSDLDPDEYQKYQDSLNNATEKPYSKAEEEVINILLIGEEAMNDDRGRSDSMMIASINQREKTLSLTSLMRDMYVRIPGYKDNKLNAAFHNGGGVLLSQTIEENFGVQIDGYVRVDFSAFEKVVDMLGGVDIELTSTEAYYLNTTNYISNRAYRNVHEGMNHLNGNQALGYCRVRYRAAGNGEANDFGRTYRQRTVLSAIFNKYKTKNPIEMIDIAGKLLDFVTTSLTKKQMISYVGTALGLGTMDLRQFRVPMDNTYRGTRRYCGGLSSSVLVVDFEENIKKLREFIYGEELMAELGPIPTSNYDIGIHGTSGIVSSGGSSSGSSQTSYTTPPPAAVLPTDPPTPAPTAKPAKTPKPTVVPTEAPEETDMPLPTEPGTSPEAVPTESPAGSEAPVPTESPAVTEPPAPSPSSEPVIATPAAETPPPAETKAPEVVTTLPPASGQGVTDDQNAA